MSTHQFQPDLPPPSNTVGVVGWLRKNLFNGPVNSIVTLILAYIVLMRFGILSIGHSLMLTGLAQRVMTVAEKVHAGCSSVFAGSSSCTASTQKQNFGALACFTSRSRFSLCFLPMKNTKTFMDLAVLCQHLSVYRCCASLRWRVWLGSG